MFQMMQETKYTEQKEEDKNKEEFSIFNWQCVSFIRYNGTSLDFVVKDQSDIMVLINVV